MDFSAFDTRRYPTIPVQRGYDEWAATYEQTVHDLMDLRLLARLPAVKWRRVDRAVDLACGTGRIGVWLKQAGVASIDGVDFSSEMLAKAKSKGVYDRLVQADILATPLTSETYSLVIAVLVDEHLADVRPLYYEASRLAVPRGNFVIAGYHPHFLMNGVPTHFDRPSGESVTIECYVHLLSDHVSAAHAAGFRMREMCEGVIDDEWIACKPKWAAYRDHPISFAIVWERAA
jgi:SAM-dependent methyltransferase